MFAILLLVGHTFCSTTFHLSPVLLARPLQISFLIPMYSLAKRCSLRVPQSSAPLRSRSRS